MENLKRIFKRGNRSKSPGGNELKKSSTRSSVASASTTTSSTSAYPATSADLLALSPLGTSTSAATASIVPSSGKENNPIGLSLIVNPEDVAVDIVLVHGLGGASRRTWCKDKNPALFWPKEWLPDALPQARIHSFGYNANFASTKGSIYGVLDFSKQLLFEMAFSPSEFGKYPVIFVAHSMGGLVVKKAYTMAKQDPEYKELVKTFAAIIFLATPHRGSNSAQTLQNLLRVSMNHSTKGYVDDLAKSSVMLQTINEDFRHVAGGLKLVSFYESLRTAVGPKAILIVEKDSATLGYSGELSTAMNADHHTVCKYSGPSDPNYLAIRNVLMKLVRELQVQVSTVKKAKLTELESIYELLGYRDSPEDLLSTYQQLRLPGSCEWIEEKDYFREWFESEGVGKQILWINGLPASGKSVLTAYIIERALITGKDCQYFFFRAADPSTHGAAAFLPSLALQIADCYESVREILLDLYSEGLRLASAEPRVIWQKVFLPIIFRIRLGRPLYWVIDALDESDSAAAILKMLDSINWSLVSLRILVLSRATDSLVNAFKKLQKNVTIRSIYPEDTLPDIKAYVKNAVNDLPEEVREPVIEKVLSRAAGCFLWVRLAIEEVQEVGHTTESIEAALENVPEGMNKFYERAFDVISSLHSQNKMLAQAIIRWSICAVRPLSLEELKEALRPEVGDVFDLERTIAKLCGHILVVDQRRRVLPVHQTVRDFLLTTSHPLGIVRIRDHEHLARICLEFLGGDSMKPDSAQSRRLEPKDWVLPKFIDYAANSWSDHLRLARADSEPLIDSLTLFLNTNVLTWIAFIASSGRLSPLIHTTRNMKAFLERRAKLGTPSIVLRGADSGMIELWAIDIYRLVTKFGKFLLETPTSIFKLVPPLCPKETIIYRQFGAPNKTLEVFGVSTMKWNDCISRVSLRESVTALAAGDMYFAVARIPGEILSLLVSTCQESRRFIHGEIVSSLGFNTTGDRLVSGGTETIKVWDLTNGEQTHAFDVGHKVLSAVFSPDNGSISSASCNNTIKTFDLNQACEVDQFEWKEESQPGRCRGFPIALKVHCESGRVAVSYRGFPVSLWEIESRNLIGQAIRNIDTDRGNSVVQDTATCMDFNRVTGHLVLGYTDGTLLKWNPMTDEQVECDVGALTIAVSDDGTIIATGDHQGTIKLWSFVTLEPIHHISNFDDSVEFLCFSPNGLRFYDIRGTDCSAWEPDALVRATKPDDDHSSFGPPAAEFTDATNIFKKRISTLVLDGTGEFCSYARDDGVVYVYSIKSGKERKLYSHKSEMSIVAQAWRDDLMATADDSARFVLHRITKTRNLKSWKTTVSISSRATGSVRQILLTGDNKKLLVFTVNSCELWDVDGVKLQSVEFSECCGTWMCLGPSRLIHMENECVQIFNDENMTSWSPRANVFHRHRRSDSDFISKVLPYPEQNLLVAQLSAKRYSPGTSSIVCWDERMEDGPQILFNGVEALVGIWKTKVVFLDKDLWVCTCDPRDREELSVKRHFFLPQDWINVNEPQLCDLTVKGGVAVVTRGDLTIISGGMLLKEKNPVS